MKGEFEELVKKDEEVLNQMEKVNEFSKQNSINVEEINENFQKNFQDIEYITNSLEDVNKQRLDKDIFFTDFLNLLYQLEDLFKKIKN